MVIVRFPPPAMFPTKVFFGNCETANTEQSWKIEEHCEMIENRLTIYSSIAANISQKLWYGNLRDFRLWILNRIICSEKACPKGIKIRPRSYLVASSCNKIRTLSFLVVSTGNHKPKTEPEHFNFKVRFPYEAMATRSQDIWPWHALTVVVGLSINAF